MNPLSVVIITRNEEQNIVECIRSARLVSSDILVIDSGSRDKTVALATEEGARVYTISWQGYGHARNLGAARALNNWILALDADERISSELSASIRKLDLSNHHAIYKFRRENYMGTRKMRFGTPGHDSVTRIYNRNSCSWDLTLVHEQLSGEKIKKIFIPGHVIHYAFKNLSDYRIKTYMYAQMSADKYLAEGRKASFTKRFLAPLFNSFKSYVLQGGFLEGKQGWIVARTIAYYTWLKYYHLNRLLRQSAKPEPAFSTKHTIETVSS